MYPVDCAFVGVKACVISIDQAMELRKMKPLASLTIICKEWKWDLSLELFSFQSFCLFIQWMFLGACLPCTTSHRIRWWSISLKDTVSHGGDRLGFFQGSSPKEQVVLVRRTKKGWQCHTVRLPREGCDSPCSPVGLAPSNSPLEGHLSKLISPLEFCMSASASVLLWWGVTPGVGEICHCLVTEIILINSVLQKSPCKRGKDFSGESQHIFRLLIHTF